MIMKTPGKIATGKRRDSFRSGEPMECSGNDMTARNTRRRCKDDTRVLQDNTG